MDRKAWKNKVSKRAGVTLICGLLLAGALSLGGCGATQSKPEVSVRETITQATAAFYQGDLTKFASYFATTDTSGLSQQELMSSLKIDDATYKQLIEIVTNNAKVEIVGAPKENNATGTATAKLKVSNLDMSKIEDTLKTEITHDPKSFTNISMNALLTKIQTEATSSNPPLVTKTITTDLTILQSVEGPVWKFADDQLAAALMAGVTNL